MKKRQKVLVTGAGGFIGHHLARFLKKKGYFVRGVDITYPQFSALSDFHDFRILDLRDFRNCIEAIIKLMESDIKKPINIGTSDHISINQLVDIICQIEGIKVKKVHQLHKIQGVRGRFCDFSKARKLLGWKPKVMPLEGLKVINKFVHKELGK